MKHGTWIRVRAGLIQSKHAIAIAKHLTTNPAFREWCPGCHENVTDRHVRTVTLGALVLVWSAARDSGRFDGNDLILDGCVISDLDSMAEVPGIGAALVSVGWAKQRDNSVVLPNFREHNDAMTEAERQRKRRERLAAGCHENVTEMSRTQRDNHVTNQTTSQKRKEKDKGSGACAQADAGGGGASHPGLAGWPEGATPEVALRAVGVRNPALAQLVANPSVTLGAIGDEWDAIRTNPDVRSRPAVLVRRLADRFGVPLTKPPRLAGTDRSALARLEERLRRNGHANGTGGHG